MLRRTLTQEHDFCILQKDADILTDDLLGRHYTGLTPTNFIFNRPSRKTGLQRVSLRNPSDGVAAMPRLPFFIYTLGEPEFTADQKETNPACC